MSIASGRDRARLIANVRTLWIEQGLYASLQPHLPLPDAPIPPRPPALTLFEEAGGALLVLGAPGSGKTFTLLELAEALLARAERDEQAPIPILFPLSSWTRKQLPLEQWCLGELARHYGVPPQLGWARLKAGGILPLLDGLDEVAASARPACVRAINEFRHSYPLVGLAVSSRKEEYAALPEPLALPTVVELQPLTLEQVDRYLAGHAGLKALRLALQEDEVLAEFAQNPLLLSMMVLTYAGTSAMALAPGTLEERRAQLFDAYLRRLLQHRSPSGTSLRTYLRWLQTVAASMASQHSITFYLSDLQPDLLTPQQRDTYRLMRGLVAGLAGGLGVGLVGTLVGGTSVGLAMGLVAVFLVGRTEMRSAGQVEMVDRFVRVQPNWQSLQEEWAEVLIGGLLIGVVVGLLGWMVMGPARGLAVGLGAVLLVELVMLGIGLMSALLGTEPSPEISEPGNASQCLKYGWLHALQSGLLAGLFGGFFGALLVGAGVALARGLTAGLAAGSTGGLACGLASGLLVGLLGSGKPLWYHVLLRAILAHAGRFPLRLVPFLEEAHALLFLRRVGGGYRFYHPLLQQHIQHLDIERFDLGTETPTPGKE